MCSIFSFSLACVVNADIFAIVWVIQTHNMWCFIPHFDRFISALDIHTDAFVRIIPASIPLTEMYLFASLHIDWHIMYFLVRYTIDFTPIHGMFRLISMSQNADWFRVRKHGLVWIIPTHRHNRYWNLILHYEALISIVFFVHFFAIQAYYCRLHAIPFPDNNDKYMFFLCVTVCVHVCISQVGW